MKKILVVGSRHDQQGEADSLATYKEYFKAVVGEASQVNSALLDDLIFDISPDKFSIFDAANNFELSDYDLIILRGKLRGDIDAAIAIANYATNNQIPYFNDYRNSRSISKLAQAVSFFNLGVPFPRTICASSKHIESMLEEDSLNLPFICKSKFGAHGNDNFLIKAPNDLKGIDTFKMVIQPFVENDGDYRILITGDDQLIIKRTATNGSYLNNTSKGGQAELVESLNERILEDAHAIAKASAMLIAGVDVIIEKPTNKYYFLEINTQPQLKTGAFVKEKQILVAKLISSLLDN